MYSVSSLFIVSTERFTWSGSPENFEGSNNYGSFEGDLKAHKSFVIGLLIFKQH